ncbi:MAG: hypothetical protein KDN22_08060 [Verrucomicrobiae bacterium]|nr:hypothetical protein [Verrucomicrobiae bacterium]
MTRPGSFGFFALGRRLAPGNLAPSHYRVIPAANASENNAIEAHVLGWLTIATWALVIDAALSSVPWPARVPLAILSAFVLIQTFTVGMALVLEKIFVATGKCSTTTARAWHTNGHVALLVLLSFVITNMGVGNILLRVLAWIWLALALGNAIAALLERRK